VITCPEPIRVPCTGASGSPVRFSLSAEDACDPDPTIDCSRDSGDTFPAGETIVECSATDASGNRTTCEFAVVVASDDPFFFRGDANRDNTVNVSDSIFILVHLFVGRAAPACLDAADVDDNGALNLSDAVFLLGFLFQGGPSPPPPGADQPGEDASPDDLGCSAPVC
jgi:hypothetical protein